MGFNRRAGHLPKTPPPSVATVGAIAKSGERIRVTCSKCNHWHDVDVRPIVEKLGEDYSLWDRRPPCKQPGCDGTVLFMYSFGEGTPFRPMKS